MKKIILLFPLIFLSKILLAQVYTVPGAQIQPAWVFPLWFEDGSGAKDTLYFSYDPNAGSVSDTIFGEKKEQLDSTMFQAYYACAIDTNFSAYKKITLTSPQIGVNICFFNTQMPLTLRWDSKVLNSDSLPLPDQAPAPRAQGVLAYDLPMQINMCSFELPLLMTDTTLYVWDTICSFSDSIVFEGPSASYLSFHVEPWKGILLGIDNSAQNLEKVFVYPNPMHNELQVIAKNVSASAVIKIMDMLGNVRLSETMRSSNFHC
ncbi:MAG: T9SS type A sorting domain-containing protein, partial [Chitinophagales bacterium]|nr:T9SS type A sorting domain-containing protein [Chitinophagales bacterium]